MKHSTFHPALSLAVKRSLAWYARPRSGSTMVETLEIRRMFHEGNAGLPDNDPVPTTEVVYPPNATPEQIQQAKASAAAAQQVLAVETTPVATASAPGITYSVNSAGLPLLTQRPDGAGLKVFLDFDGYNADLPFSTDADTTTFNSSEQQVIVQTWRDIVSFFSPLDVNVTTVQPPTGGSNPVFAWQRISNSISGGAAYVGWLTNDSSNGWTGSDNALSRHSGIAHEIGHQLSLNHESEYDKYGVKTSEYTDGFGPRDRAVIGVDYAENVRGWFYGRDSDSAYSLADDLVKMASKVASVVGGDGYRPDDYAGTQAAATTIPASGLLDGIIERNNDVDEFKFTSVGGTYQLDATPTFESGVAPKIELLDSSGNILAARDDADRRNGNSNNQEFSDTLPAGTYYVKVSSSGDISEQGEYTVTASLLPGTGWASQDVNDPYRGGSASYNAATNTLTQFGGGTDIWNANDQFRFTSQVLNGDGSITARIDSLDNTDPNAKAGVMIRQSMANNSALAYVGIKPSGQLDPIIRSTAGGGAFSPANTTGVNGPWVRLTRTGNSFAIFRSTDGVTWTPIATTTVSMTGPVYIGFATCSLQNRAVAWSTFSNIAVTGSLGAAVTVPNGLTPPAGLVVTPATGANTSLVLNWTDGASETGYSIDRSLDGVVFTQVGTTAANVTTYTDANLFGSMRYFYRVAAMAAGNTRSTPSAIASAVNKPNAPTNPDSSYAVTVIAPSSTELLLNWSDVQGDEGYRVERSTDGGASYTVIATRPKNYNAYNDSGLTAGTAYTCRITAITSIGDGAAAPFIINATTRLAGPANLIFTSKAATSFGLQWSNASGATGYRIERSPDDVTFTSLVTLGAGVLTYTDNTVTPVNEYYYRVVALTPSLDGVSSNMIFAATPPATPNLPAGWTNVDVGTVPGTGTSSFDGTTWTVLGSGADIWNTADQFQYASRPLTGDGSMIARVASLENADYYTKGGIMMRDTTAAGSRYVFLHLTPGVGVQLEYRDAAGSGSGGTVQVPSTAPVWLRLVRTGNSFVGSYSTDGTTWLPVATHVATLNTNSLVGFALASHNVTQLARATFTDTTVVGLGLDTTPPIAPVISAITTDTGSNTTDHLTSDNTLVLSGTAEAGSVVTITRQGLGVIGTATATVGGTWSFDYTATVLADATYTFTATARDASGNTSVASTAFVVTVNTAIPTVTITPTQSPAGSPVNSVTIVFSQPVTGFTIARLSLIPSGGSNLLTAAQTLTTTDNQTFTLGNLSAVASAAKTYTLVLTTSGVSNVVGTSLSATTASANWTVVPTTLTLSGSTLYLRLNADGQHIDVWPNTTGLGTVVQSIARTGITTLNVTGTSGDDFLTVDLSNGALLTSGSIVFTGGAQTLADSMKIIGTTGIDQITIDATTVSIAGSSSTEQFSGVESLIIDPLTGLDTLTVTAGRVQLPAQPTTASTLLTRMFDSISVAAGATLVDATSPAAVNRSVLVVSALSLATGATLDLGNNDMVLKNSTPATVDPMLKAGFNGGSWTGAGIGSSTASGNITHLTTVGEMVNNDGFGNRLYGTGTTAGLFDGQSPGLGDILLKYTYFGDANLDGAVDGSDYTKIDAAFGPTAASGWLNGDFNYDSTIDGSDYTLIDNAFNTQGTPYANSMASSALIAEPTSLTAGTLAGQSLNTTAKNTAFFASFGTTQISPLSIFSKDKDEATSQLPIN